MEEFRIIYFERLARAFRANETPICRISNDDKSEIVLSYDQNYSPFIPANLGFNSPRERIRIRDCRVTRELGLGLQRVRIELNDMPGGRVFIRKNGSFLKLKDGSLRLVSGICLED